MNTPEYMRLAAQAMKEAELVGLVIEYAQARGWMVAHFRPARTDKGWRTPVQGDGKGFPDLILAREARTIGAECKSQTGELSPEQLEWLEAIGGFDWRTLQERHDPRARAFCWRPLHWLDGSIEEVLQ